MIKILKYIYHICKRPFKWLGFYWKRFSNFIYPNISNILKHRIVFIDYPMFNQITLCEGAGKVEIGKHCFFGYKLGGFHRGGSIELQARYKESKIKIGNDVLTNNNIFLCAANYIEIGDETLIGQNVTIMDHEAHSLDPMRRKDLGEIGKVIIGKNVWIGNNVTILKNSVIGENTIIATGAVVSGVFPSNVVIGGVPAKVIKSI